MENSLVVENQNFEVSFITLSMSWVRKEAVAAWERTFCTTCSLLRLIRTIAAIVYEALRSSNWIEHRRGAFGDPLDAREVELLG